MTRRRIPREVRAAYAHARRMLGARAEVSGVDVGFKYRDGVATDQMAVRVHVIAKRARKHVGTHERIPKQLLGIATDVIEAKYKRHASELPKPWQRHDVLRPGISVGSPKAEAGTLGLMVYDRESGAPCLLGSFHVLAGHFAQVGDPITQPARIDHGDLVQDTIATLLRFYLPGAWGDAAIAKLTGARNFVPEQCGSSVCVAGVSVPSLGQVLEKSGRTTGVTRGKVDGLGTYYYAEAPTGVRGFRLAPITDAPDAQDLSASGDSGSVYYVPDACSGVGLHCAGEVGDPAHEFAIACYLGRVPTTLGVSLEPSAKEEEGAG